MAPDPEQAPCKGDLPRLAARIVTAYYRKDYDTVLGHLASDFLFIGAGSDITWGLRDLAKALSDASEMPSFLVRDARFHVVEAGSPSEAVIAGFYTIYSDADHQMLSSERQRITINCRHQGGGGVPASWPGPHGPGGALPGQIRQADRGCAPAHFD